MFHSTPYTTDHPEIITKKLRAQAEELDWSDIEFPVAVDENVIRKFERNNNVSVNIFGYDDKDGVYPLIVSKHASERFVDLLQKMPNWLSNS